MESSSKATTLSLLQRYDITFSGDSVFATNGAKPCYRGTTALLQRHGGVFSGDIVFAIIVNFFCYNRFMNLLQKCKVFATYILYSCYNSINFLLHGIRRGLWRKSPVRSPARSGLLH